MEIVGPFTPNESGTPFTDAILPKALVSAEEAVIISLLSLLPQEKGNQHSSISPFREVPYVPLLYRCR